MESHKNIAKAAGIISLATIFCRIAGLGREVVTANFFGTALVYDAFLIAFMIPNFFRGLFAEGALSTAFIPVFTGYVTTKEKKETERIASIGFTLSFVATSSLVILSILGIFIFSHFFHFSTKVTLILRLLKITLPYLILISLAAIAMGILNSYQHFATPAFAPIMLDLCWIGAIFLLCPLFGESIEKRIFGLAVGVLIGGLGQFLIQWPILKKRKLKLRFNLNFRHPAIKRMVILLAPSVIGVAVTPINILVDSLLAIRLGEGMVSSLWYANRLMQLPLGIFGVAMATATLPTLSAYFAQGELKKLKETLSFALRNVLFIIIPASVGLILLRRPIISLLFQRGLFNATSAENTAFALLFYAIGLFAYAASIIVVRGFYSIQDTKTPVKVGLLSILANIVLDLILMGPLRQGGIALSTSFVGMINLGILSFILGKRLKGLDGRKILSSTLQTLLISGLMGILVWSSLLFCQGTKILILRNRFALVFIPAIIGIGFYLLFSYLWGREEMRSYRRRE